MTGFSDRMKDWTSQTRQEHTAHESNSSTSASDDADIILDGKDVLDFELMGCCHGVQSSCGYGVSV